MEKTGDGDSGCMPNFYQNINDDFFSNIDTMFSNPKSTDYMEAIKEEKI